jgi:hypothetical protein
MVIVVANHARSGTLIGLLETKLYVPDQGSYWLRHHLHRALTLMEHFWPTLHIQVAAMETEHAADS